MIMRNFEKMAELGKMKHMPEFVSNCEGEGTLNLETYVESEFLEQYSNTELEIFQESTNVIAKDVPDVMLEKMLNYDVELSVNPFIKMQHTYIDFCPLIFQRKLDYLLEDGFE